jgi:predicted permease
MGQAFSPLALLLVGISLAHILDRRPDRSPSPTTASGDQSSRAPGAQAGIALRTTLAISLMKNLLHPLLVAGLCALLGIRGLSAVVIIVAAALPTGATVFMFAQRYGVARDQVASAVAFSTAVALGVLPVAMLAAQWLL